MNPGILKRSCQIGRCLRTASVRKNQLPVSIGLPLHRFQHLPHKSQVRLIQRNQKADQRKAVSVTPSLLPLTALFLQTAQGRYLIRIRGTDLVTKSFDRGIIRVAKPVSLCISDCFVKICPKSHSQHPPGFHVRCLPSLPLSALPPWRRHRQDFLPLRPCRI